MKALQGDYASLQASHDRLEEGKLSAEKAIASTREDLVKLKSELKDSEGEIRCLKQEKEHLNEKIREFELNNRMKAVLTEVGSLYSVDHYSVMLTDLF